MASIATCAPDGADFDGKSVITTAADIIHSIMLVRNALQYHSYLLYTRCMPQVPFAIHAQESIDESMTGLILVSGR